MCNANQVAIDRRMLDYVVGLQPEINELVEDHGPHPHPNPSPDPSLNPSPNPNPNLAQARVT